MCFELLVLPTDFPLFYARLEPKLMLNFCSKVFVIFLVFVLFPGCAEPRTKVEKVTGLVTLKGKPLELVSVEFWPTNDGGMRAVGKTDNEGKFTLQTDDGLQAGATVGKNVVLIRDTWHMQDDYIDKNSGEMVDMSKGRKGRISWKYFEVTTTPLSAEVKAGEKNAFTFEVTP